MSLSDDYLSNLTKISELEIESRMLKEVNTHLAIKCNELQKEKFQNRQNFQKLEARIKELEAKLEAAKPEEPEGDPYRFEVLSISPLRETLKGYLTTKIQHLQNRHYVLESCNSYEAPSACAILSHEEIQTIVTTLQKVLDDGVLKK
jgi:hypothetical protein